MKKNALYLFLLVFCTIACTKDEEAAQVIPKQALGDKALVWVKPFQNAQSLTFTNQKGDLKTFSVTKKQEASLVIAIDTGTKTESTEAERLTFVLRNTAKPTEFIRYRLVGDIYVFVNDEEERLKDEDDYLFRLLTLKGNFIDPNIGYNIQIGYKTSDIVLEKYTYGDKYPEFGDDKLSLKVTKNASAFKQLTLSHGRGLESFKDANDVEWKLLKIN
jgi:hypothetical protein